MSDEPRERPDPVHQPAQSGSAGTRPGGGRLDRADRVIDDVARQMLDHRAGPGFRAQVLARIGATDRPVTWRFGPVWKAAAAAAALGLIAWFALFPTPPAEAPESPRVAEHSPGRPAASALIPEATPREQTVPPAAIETADAAATRTGVVILPAPEEVEAPGGTAPANPGNFEPERPRLVPDAPPLMIAEIGTPAALEVEALGVPPLSGPRSLEAGLRADAAEAGLGGPAPIIVEALFVAPMAATTR